MLALSKPGYSTICSEILTHYINQNIFFDEITMPSHGPHMKSERAMLESYKVVLGVIGSDCHVVGNRILDRFLSNAGIEVVNLGVMVSQEEFMLAAQAENADAILVSSIYGHGEIDCQGLRELCQENGIGDLLLYVGGNLVIGKKDWKDVESLFLEMGYDRVFAPNMDLANAVCVLKDDIDMQRISRLGHNSTRRHAPIAAVI